MIRFGFLLIAVFVFGAEPLAFEAVSIKPHPEPVYVSRSDRSGTYASWTAGTLRDLITEAWNLKYYQVAEQPSWIRSEHFDISARASGNAEPPKDVFRQMLQTMLADRFHLRVHFETRELPVYALMIGKPGHKLKPADPAAHIGYWMSGAAKTEIAASDGNMPRLADQLSTPAGRPVFDKTGLDGAFAYKLTFNSSTEESDLPSLPTALQDQLGLRLESQKAPIDILVIDSAERPGEN